MKRMITGVAGGALWTCLGACAGVQPLQAPPQPVMFTLDATANADFTRRVTAIFGGLQRRLDGRLCYPLSSQPLRVRPAFCEGQPVQAITQVLVLRNGVLWRMATSHPGLFDAPGQVASLSKAVLAVPLLAHAGADADETWCRQAVAGIRNADGYEGEPDCRAARAWVPARRAAAKSDNLAFAWRLRQMDPSFVQRQLDKAGIAGMPPKESVDRAIPLGHAPLSPRQVLECFHALAAGEAQRAAIVRQARQPPTPLARWCAASVQSEQGRLLVSELLAQPARPHGTAAYLGPLLGGQHARIIAKTGTPTDAQRRDVGKLLVFAVTVGDQTYTALISMTAPSPSRPLAAKLSSADLAGVAKLVAASIKADAAVKSPHSRHPVLDGSTQGRNQPENP